MHNMNFRKESQDLIDDYSQFSTEALMNMLYFQIRSCEIVLYYMTADSADLQKAKKSKLDLEDNSLLMPIRANLLMIESMECVLEDRHMLQTFYNVRPFINYETKDLEVYECYMDHLTAVMYALAEGKMDVFDMKIIEQTVKDNYMKDGIDISRYLNEFIAVKGAKDAGSSEGIA